MFNVTSNTLSYGFFHNILSWLFARLRFSIISDGLNAIDSSSILNLDASLPYPALYGWYMVEVDYAVKSKLIKSELLVSDKKGQYSLALPCFKGKKVKRICYFSSSSNVQIRVDNGSNRIFSKNAKVKFVKLTEKFALSRMLNKFELRGYRPNNITVASELYEHYSDVFLELPRANSYKNWMRNIEPFIWSPILDVSLQDIKISILVPVYNTPVIFLSECIKSVLNQTYRNWELIIVDDCSTSLETIEFLNNLEIMDDRIKVVFRDKNGHISLATNTAIENASGDYLLFLDHDDTLSSNALNEVVFNVNGNRDAALIYSDEDKITSEGERYEPHFKPGFSPETLISQNYICHLMVVKKELVLSIHGLRATYEGSQDYDLLLRMLPYLNNENVIHIPKILYHWRSIEGSTASNPNEKSYSWDAGVNALQNYLDSNLKGFNASKGLMPNTYKLSMDLGEQPFVTVIIPTRNRLDLIKVCLDTLLSITAYQNFEVIILDNDSDDLSTIEYLKQVSQVDKVKVIHAPGDFNFSKINNIGAKYASGELLCLLNNDIEIFDGNWMAEMVVQTLRPDVGCVGAKLLYPDDTVQHGGVILGLGGVAGHSHLGFGSNEPGYFDRLAIVHNTSAVTAACLMIKKSIFDEVNGLDEALPIAFNDIDFCLRVSELGYRNIWTPYSVLYHHESASRGYEETPEKIIRFSNESEFMKNRWGSSLSEDPFYNFNFDLNSHSYQLKAVL